MFEAVLWFRCMLNGGHLVFGEGTWFTRWDPPEWAECCICGTRNVSECRNG